MTMLEKLAYALRDEMGRQWDAHPIPGDANPDSWTATGGVLDLEQSVRAVLTALREPDKRAWEAARWTDDDGHAEPSLNTLAEFLPAYIEAILNEKAA